MVAAFTGYDNSGVNTFANSLSNLGQQFGEAFKQQGQQQMLSEFGKLYASGDHKGAMNAAVAMGRPDLAVQIGTKLQEREADKAAFGIANGGAASSANGAPAVTNTGTPMNLPSSGSARGDRNNNFGNINDSSFAKSQTGYVGTDGRFAMFDTPQHGFDAQVNLLGSYGDKGVNTLSGIISKWAPASENGGAATANYIATVAKDLGINPGDKLDMSDPNLRATIARSMSKVELGRSNFEIPQGAIGGYGPSEQRANPNLTAQNNGQQNDGSPSMSSLQAMSRNLMQAMSSPGISDSAKNQLKVQYDDVQHQIDRLDKSNNRAEDKSLEQKRLTQSDPAYKQQQEVAQRKKDLIALGKNPEDPANQQYILTGRFPKEDQQQLTATDKKAIMEADDAVAATKGVISSLQYAKQLSPKAMGFRGAGMLAEGGALVGNEASIATKELDNVVTSNTLSQLKTIFGGNPTEGEREILRQLEGSSSQPDAVRQKIYDRAIQMAETRMKFNQSRADELRGGTYYDSKDSKKATGSVTLNAPTGEHLAGAKKALEAGVPRDKVEAQLKDLGFSTEGL